MYQPQCGIGRYGLRYLEDLGEYVWRLLRHGGGGEEHFSECGARGGGSDRDGGGGV